MHIKHFDKGKMSFKVHPPKCRCAFSKSRIYREIGGSCISYKLRDSQNHQSWQFWQRYLCMSSISHWIYILSTQRPLYWQLTNSSMRNTERVWAKPVTVNKLQENSLKPLLEVDYSNSLAMRKQEKKCLNSFTVG